MMEAANKNRDKLILYVLYDSGVRRQELLSLKIDDIDFEDE